MKLTIRQIVDALDPDQGLAVPHIEMTEEKVRRFLETFEKARLLNGGILEYQLSYPKHEFLTFLSQTNRCLFHGSNDTGICKLTPRQASDATEDGSKKAVYAASDPIQPLFYAAINRDRMLAACRPDSDDRWYCGINGFFKPPGSLNAQDDPLYFFAASDFTKDHSPWDKGAVYLLPITGFTSDYCGQQWLSQEEVFPYARMIVGPDDFPFKESMCWLNMKEFLRRMHNSVDGFPWYNDVSVATFNARPNRSQQGGELDALSRASYL